MGWDCEWHAQTRSSPWQQMEQGSCPEKVQRVNPSRWTSRTTLCTIQACGTDLPWNEDGATYTVAKLWWGCGNIGGRLTQQNCKRCQLAALPAAPTSTDNVRSTTSAAAASKSACCMGSQGRDLWRILEDSRLWYFPHFLAVYWNSWSC